MSKKTIFLIVMIIVILVLIIFLSPKLFSILERDVLCQKEGGFLYPPMHSYSTCCGNLDKIGYSSDYNEACVYSPGLGNYGVCSNCGNNVCEQWESKCNCSKDCN